MNANEGIFSPWDDETYPRPQLRRSGWASLNGTWDFASDPDDVGIRDNWFALDSKSAAKFTSQIEVPYPPGSELSGVMTDAPQDVPDVVWYARAISPAELKTAGEGTNVRLNFEAVDYRADVWVNGQYVGGHTGGYTPFYVDLGSARTESKYVVVRAEDRKDNTAQPRGKQAWRDKPDGIWYHRSTGIWRDVWMEAVPTVSVDGFSWDLDLDRGILHGTVTLSSRAPIGSKLSIALGRGDKTVAETSSSADSSDSVAISLSLPALLNRMDWAEWLWAPEHPNLWDLQIVLEAGSERDLVSSYVGLRTVDVDNRYININRMPVFIRGVLDQGYWPESFFTAPSPDAIRGEVALIQSLGFNLSRIHERTPDRRYLAWADHLGLLVWGESASTYHFNDESVLAVTKEWAEIVVRDRAAPCIIAWVPFNESWGVPQIESDSRQRALVASVVALTRALDPTRPVSANDGWEQLDTDFVTTHDYGTTYEELFVNYEDLAAVAQTVNGVGPQGRKTLLETTWADDKPVLVSEFGGISMVPDTDNSPNWGYDTVATSHELTGRLSDLFTALLESPVLAGFCYTQLTDTLQEANGICRADRTPKAPVEVLRKIVTNTDPHSAQIRPRTVTADATKKERQ